LTPVETRAQPSPSNRRGVTRASATKEQGFRHIDCVREVETASHRSQGKNEPAARFHSLKLTIRRAFS
jgi:hypothetical protein